MGTVKTNVGHTECASFLVGLLKAMIMIENDILLPNRFTHNLYPKINFEKYNLMVQTKVESFDFNYKYILINSFGFGGSNGCCLISKYNQINNVEKREDFNIDLDYNLKLIRSQTKKGLEQRYQQISDYSPYAINTSYQPYFYHSFSINNQELEKPINTDLETQRMMFIFSGQGPQHPEMGKEFYHKFAKFKEVIDVADTIYENLSGVSLRNDLGLFTQGKENPRSMDVYKIEYTLPAIVMFQLALFELWKYFGVTPDVSVGHSFGEILAIYAAGQ